MAATATQVLENGVRLYTGGRELSRAAAALSRGLQEKDKDKEKEKEKDHTLGLDEEVEALIKQLSSAGMGNYTTQQRRTTAGMRELAAAAQQYAAASAHRPDDFDLLYNHALVLQELASRVAMERNIPLDGLSIVEREDRMKMKMQFLTQACDRYEAAWKVTPESAATLYNWGVALSDIALLAKMTEPDKARKTLLAAARKYELSLKHQPNNPQALNNWGLVLRELSIMKSLSDSQPYLRQAVAKFRRAIRIRPEFDRACYNLGTVLFNYANSLQHDGASATSWATIQEVLVEGSTAKISREEKVRKLQALAGQYIVLAYAIQPAKEVYIDSLGRSDVQKMMPLPCLKAGPLSVPTRGEGGVEQWERKHLVVDHQSLRWMTSAGSSTPRAGDGTEESDGVLIQVSDIRDSHRCCDPSLPKGSAFWVALHSSPKGMYFVADNEDDAEGWVDALHMIAHICKEKHLEHLQKALDPRTTRLKKSGIPKVPVPK